MSTWASITAYPLAWLVVAMQTFFGWKEMFRARSVFAMVFPVTYHATESDTVWCSTEKLALNMGLYNWFLALGLALSLTGRLGGAPTARFFLFCVAVAGAFALKVVLMHWTFGLQLGLGLAALAMFFGLREER